MVMDSGHVCQSPDEEFLLTVVATLSSSELKVRPACCTAARLTSKRTFFPSRTNWIMPPRWENCGMSLTVKTACLFRVLMVVLSGLSSAELRNRIWQLADSCGVEIRLAATLFPAIVSPASVASRAGPKGSWPRTQTVNESFLADCDVRRPFDEAAKVVKIGSLHVVVSGLWTLRPQTWNGNQHPSYGQQP